MFGDLFMSSNEKNTKIQRTIDEEEQVKKEFKKLNNKSFTKKAFEDFQFAREKEFQDVILVFVRNEINNLKASDSIKKTLEAFHIKKIIDSIMESCYVSGDTLTIVRESNEKAKQKYMDTIDIMFIEDIEKDMNSLRREFEDEVITEEIKNFVKENQTKILKAISETISNLVNSLSKISGSVNDYIYFGRNPIYRIVEYSYNLKDQKEDDRNIVDKEIEKYISKDDKISLETFVDTHNVKFSNKVFDRCAEYLAESCFVFFYSLITSEELKLEKSFLNLCLSKAADGCNYDGRKFYKISGKPQVPNEKAKDYTIQRGSIVPESIFVCAFKSFNRNNKANTEKILSMVRLFMKFEIPIGDQVLESFNDDDNIQGYNSMIKQYMTGKR